MTRKPALSVIVSGMPSVGKTTVAEKIAKKFRLRHIAGGDMLKKMALARGYSPSGADWWDTNEGMNFLSERETNPEFDREVDRLLAREIKMGGVVVTSYPIAWITSGGLRLWLKASAKTRALRLAGRDKISEKDALRTIRKRDRRNRTLYMKLYGIDFGRDLTVFNYIIDTDNLAAGQVAAQSLALVKEYASSLKKRKRPFEKK